MAREILFKAKRLDNGEWVEGDLLHSVYKINDTCVGKYGCEVGMHQVDENTICQYTGLTDTNGNKIWENDIIRLFDMTMEDYIVGWSKDMGAYVICDINTKAELLDLVGDCVQEITYVDVIGNIFDNPELLGGVASDERIEKN